MIQYNIILYSIIQNRNFILSFTYVTPVYDDKSEGWAAGGGGWVGWVGGGWTGGWVGELLRY